MTFVSWGKPRDPRKGVGGSHRTLVSWEEAFVSPELLSQHLSIQLMLAFFYLLMQPFVTVSNTCMRNKAVSNFLAKIPLSHLPGLYLMPSKSMWQSKSAIRKKVFFCPHVKQMQCLAETISFQAFPAAHDGYLVAQCEGVRRCGMIGRVVGTSLAIKRYNVILMSGFFLDLHLNDLFKSSKRQNMSTISAFSPDMENHTTFCYYWCGMSDCQLCH